jgi:hypothetical protein
VLDYSINELQRLKQIAPAGEGSKIDLHAEAIRNVEEQLAVQIEQGTISVGCEPPTPPDSSLMGENSGRNGDYGRAETNAADDQLHEQIGKAHAGIIKAAFQCDLMRVATFQWSPGTNHVSFAGQYPDNPNAIYMHHPLSHVNLSDALQIFICS